MIVFYFYHFSINKSDDWGLCIDVAFCVFYYSHITLISTWGIILPNSIF